MCATPIIESPNRSDVKLRINMALHKTKIELYVMASISKVLQSSGKLFDNAYLSDVDNLNNELIGVRTQLFVDMLRQRKTHLYNDLLLNDELLTELTYDLKVSLIIFSALDLTNCQTIGDVVDTVLDQQCEYWGIAKI